MNTFLSKDHRGDIVTEIDLIRSAEGEKGKQIDNVKYFRIARNSIAPHDVGSLQDTARERKNIFAALVEAVKAYSLGQVSHALYAVGGEYRRNM